MIRFKDVTFVRERLILDNVSFEVKKGEVFGIVGASGVGKSTLLSLLCGLEDVSKGEIYFEKQIVAGPSQRLIAGHPEIQLVNQEFELDLYHTVRENIGMKMNHLPIGLRGEFTEELLELMDLKQCEQQKAISLSGGEKQRLAILRALALEPKVIVLDEPFSHLDGTIKRKLLVYISQLKKTRKTTFLLVSHDGEEMMTLADRVLYLADRKVQRIDVPSEFYNYPQSMAEGLLFGDLNEVRINRKKHLFRPNAYRITPDELCTNLLHVRFLSASFSGFYYKNYFLVGRNNRIVLYHTNLLNDVKEIYIS